MAKQVSSWITDFDLDLLAKRRPQQLGGIDHQRVNIDLARLQRLLARERQQMLGQVGAARGGFIDHLGDGGELRFVLDRVGDDLDRSGDHGQDIVEIVRDAAGELAERFHFLGLPDAVLRRDPVGQVARESVEHHAVAAP